MRATSTAPRWRCSRTSFPSRSIALKSCAERAHRFSDARDRRRNQRHSRGRIQRFHIDAGFEGGGLGTFRERLQVSGGGKSFGYELGANRLDVRNGIDGDDAYGNTGFAGRFQFYPTQSITIAANLYGAIANGRINDSPFPLPAAFASSQRFPDAIPGVTFQPDFNNPDQGRRHRLIVGSGRFTHVANDHISYSIAYQRVSSNRRNYNGPNVDPQFASFVPFGDFEFLNVNRGNIDTVDSRVNIRFARSNLATGGSSSNASRSFKVRNLHSRFEQYDRPTTHVRGVWSGPIIVPRRSTAVVDWRAWPVVSDQERGIVRVFCRERRPENS